VSVHEYLARHEDGTVSDALAKAEEQDIARLGPSLVRRGNLAQFFTDVIARPGVQIPIVRILPQVIMGCRTDLFHTPNEQAGAIAATPRRPPMDKWDSHPLLGLLCELSL